MCSYRDPPWPTCTCSLWDEPFLLLPVRDNNICYCFNSMNNFMKNKFNSTCVVCSATHFFFFPEKTYCFCSTHKSNFHSLRSEVSHLLLWESEARSPRRPWTDERGRIRCHWWWNSHLLQPTESFLGWRKCPWTASPSVPAKDNANISMLGAEAEEAGIKEACLWTFLNSKLGPGLCTMKTKPCLQMRREPHQNIFIRPFQAVLRGRRSILLAAGMHSTFRKTQNMTNGC